ncbi:ThuA domain-containing protein [Salinibacterium sp. SWN139]|uniref:ThuA domain-containing protein n=1 Tax=Salinibacterium sp. SWN139 TaxID=2792055 RepID=UPI001E2E85B6|nr:ThuA domain-containing protein [Salinibacterium sp. SWN139]
MTAERERAPLALIASGGGRYGDPWHPFDETSAALAMLLEADGWRVIIDSDVDHALTRLDDVQLLVVNAGDPSRNIPDSIQQPTAALVAAATASLARAIDRGMGILATHTAVASLRDYPRWRASIGGVWRVGTSWHPPLALSSVHVRESSHPISRGTTDFTLVDELYTDLEVDDNVCVLVDHSLDGVVHPLLWARETTGRAVVSAFGHDVRAYESTAVQHLVRRAARWASRIDS